MLAQNELTLSIMKTPHAHEILDKLGEAGSLLAGVSSVGLTIACRCYSDRLEDCVDVLSAYVPQEYIFEPRRQQRYRVRNRGWSERTGDCVA